LSGILCPLCNANICQEEKHTRVHRIEVMNCKDQEEIEYLKEKMVGILLHSQYRGRGFPGHI